MPNKPALSECQARSLDMCIEAARSKEGRFIFVTGKAGTGKSTVLRQLRERLGCLVCAPTGLAAVNVRGATIHRAFGLKIGPQVRSKVSAMRFPDVAERASAIVVDEISMVRADVLDAMSWCLQKTLGNRKPFGGKTIIAFGDMMQLEPVVGDREQEWVNQNYKSPFWFDAKVFAHSDQATLDGDSPGRVQIEICELEHVFRQEGDPFFIDALNAIRLGDPSGLPAINGRAFIEPLEGAPEPVALTMTNKRAESVNALRLAGLDGDPLLFEGTKEGDFDDSEMPIPRDLSLAVGARVMVCRNMDTDYGYVANGDLGHVVGFYGGRPIVTLDDGRSFPVEKATWERLGYKFDAKKDTIEESVEGRFMQFPLKLAWAITVHKSQGQTLDSAVLELESQARTHGQLYVALSRVRQFDGLFLRRRLSSRDLVVSDRVREFCGISPTELIAQRPDIDLGVFA